MAGKETSSGALWCKHPVAVQLSLGTAPDNYHLKSSCRQLPSLEPLWTRQASLPHHQPTRQAATNQTPPDIYKHQTFAETKLLYQVSKKSYQVGISGSQYLVTIANKYKKIYFHPAANSRTVLVSFCFWGMWESKNSQS